MGVGAAAGEGGGSYCTSAISMFTYVLCTLFKHDEGCYFQRDKGRDRQREIKRDTDIQI